MPQPRALGRADLPSLYLAGSRTSGRGQRAFLRVVRLRLGLILGIAAASLFTWHLTPAGPDLAALLTVLGLAGVLVLELLLQQTRPEDAWFDGRVLAESVKKVSWRYSVGADPFPRMSDVDDRNDAADSANAFNASNVDEWERRAELAFTAELRTLLHDVTSIPEPTRPTTVTPAMAALRAAPLAERREVYLRDRIEEQRVWYTTRSGQNQRRSGRLRALMLLLELGAIAAAVLRAANLVSLDLAGLAATILAVGAAWLGVKQYDTLARAYSFAAHDLGIVYDRLRATATEREWAAEAADAEESISREHTLWRASRSRTV